MQEMFYASIAIGLMFAANFIITFARQKTRGWMRGILSLVAFLCLPPVILFAVLALF